MGGDIAMPIVEPRHENRIGIDLPTEERLLPIHVPEHVERYALQLADRYGGDVEQWVLQCLAFNVRLLLRHDRPEGARTHTVHTSVDAETFAAVHASGRPERFVRQAVREKIERARSVENVDADGPILAGP